MKNYHALFLIFMLLCIITIPGCSKGTGGPGTGNPPDHFSDNLPAGTDYLSLGYNDFYKETLRMITPEDDLIGIKSAEINFDGQGGRKNVFLNIWALESRKDNTDYWADCTLEMDESGISCNKISTVNLLTAYNPVTGNGMTMMNLKDFKDIFDSFDMKTLLDEQRVGSPAFYTLYFQPNAPEPTIILDDRANTKYLYLSEEGIKETGKPQELTASGWYLPDKVYLIIVPYYEKQDGMTGVNEHTVGQGENAKTYIGANLVVLLAGKGQNDPESRNP